MSPVVHRSGEEAQEEVYARHVGQAPAAAAAAARRCASVESGCWVMRRRKESPGWSGTERGRLDPTGTCVAPENECAFGGGVGAASRRVAPEPVLPGDAHLLLILEVDRGEAPEEAEDGTGRPHGRVRVEPVGEERPGERRGAVDGGHALRAEQALGGGADVVEGEAVDGEVDEVAVEEGRGQEAPPLPGVDQRVDLGRLVRGVPWRGSGDLPDADAHKRRGGGGGARRGSRTAAPLPPTTGTPLGRSSGARRSRR